MHLFSFFLFCKAFSFLVVLVSSCSPGNRDGFISISLMINSNYRFNILGFNLYPNNTNSSPEIGTWNSGSQPSDDEVFVLKQLTTGVYEFRPFISFYQNLVIKPDGSNFTVSQSSNGDDEKFSIECDTCNLNANGSENWVKYHSSCLIKNSVSGLCMNGKDLQANLVTQVDCPIASRWDIFGILSDKFSISTSGSSTMVNSTSGVISKLELAGVIIGSNIGTASISFIVSYCIIKHKFSRNVRIANPINN